MLFGCSTYFGYPRCTCTDYLCKQILFLLFCVQLIFFSGAWLRGRFTRFSANPFFHHSSFTYVVLYFWLLTRLSSNAIDSCGKQFFIWCSCIKLAMQYFKYLWHVFSHKESLDSKHRVWLMGGWHIQLLLRVRHFVIFCLFFLVVNIVVLICTVVAINVIALK